MRAGANNVNASKQLACLWLFVAIVLLSAGTVRAFAADGVKQFHYTVGRHASISIRNPSGAVVVKPSDNNQVSVIATLHSSKVEVEPTQVGDRLSLSTHFLQAGTPEERRVDYEVSVPTDASVNVVSSSGPISAEGLKGDVILEGDAAQVNVSRVSDAHVHVRTLTGSIALQDINNGHVEASSLSGPVTLTHVAGTRVSVNTTSGKITYTGDFSGGGDYSLTNHSGDIEVTIPAAASVDISARSITGSVDSDVPLQQRQHNSFQPVPGKALTGMSNSGSSSVRLLSFSGKIRLKKQ